MNFVDLEDHVSEKLGHLPWEAYAAVICVALNVYESLGRRSMPGGVVEALTQLRNRVEGFICRGEDDPEGMSRLTDLIIAFIDDDSDYDFPLFVHQIIEVAAAFADEMSDVPAGEVIDRRVAAEYATGAIERYPGYANSISPGSLADIEYAKDAVDESNPGVMFLRALERSAEFAEGLNSFDIDVIRKVGFGEGENDLVRRISVE
ncbi:MAG: hypothetical protein FWE35_21330 [Streptosporangiales bacterium]|nr:hypothetical protein [Streptosporangiales bacterium]